MIFHTATAVNNKFKINIQKAVNPPFLLYYFFMEEKLGAFIVPTGVGASIGGYAGDASVWARKFAQKSRLIVNPNVVNAGGFSGITDNMLYVEGYSLDSFFKGEICLQPSVNNKIGVIFDRAIPKDVLNIHINTMNAVKTVYGTNIIGYEISEDEVGVEFFMTEQGISVGSVNNIETLYESAKKMLEKGADALAIVCLFDDAENLNTDYSKGTGTDPVGGVEAIISHSISKKFKVPCAHSPAFADYSICSELVDAKSAAEYITPTFLPCILLGLANAPKISKSGIGISDVDYLVVPYDALGSVPVFEALKRNIPVYAVKENVTVLDVTNETLHKSNKITVVDTYQQCYDLLF